jgi:hypothetical protein
MLSNARKRWALFVFSSIGLGWLLIGLFTVWRTYKFIGHSVPVQGKIVALQPETQTDSDGQHSITYAPVFAFTAHDGASYTVTSSSSSNPPSYKVGEAVSVLYELDNPQTAKISSFFGLWFLPAIFGGGGVAFSLVSLAIVLRGRGAIAQ